MIDTEALRKKVIDLAMRGKLTEQLPEDGTAEELYAQIQAEKARLVKEGKIKKEKPLPAIEEDEIPFEIPKNWKWVRLSEISDTNIGLTYHPENVIEHGTVVLRSNNIQNGKFDFSDLVEVNCTIRDNQYLKTNDILICSRNGSKRLVGKCAIYNGELGDVSFGAFMAILRTPLYKYIYYYLKTEAFRRYYSNDDSKQINQVTQDILKKAIVPLPSLAEQKRIADKIDSVLSEIDIIDAFQSQYHNNLEALKSKIIDAGIRGKLTEQLPTDGTAEELYAQIQEEKQQILSMRNGRKDKPLSDEDHVIPFEIPSNWKWIHLGEVGLFKKGPFGSALTKSMFVPKANDTVKVYEQQNAIKKDETLGSYYISREYFEDKMRGFEVLPEDIIVSCAGTIGESYIMPNEIEQGIINQALMRITLVPSINREFFLYYFDSHLKYDAQLEGKGMAIKNIPPFDIMKKWYFPLPPLAEQKRIADKIDEVLQVIQ